MIEVERISEDGLRRKVWRFIPLDYHKDFILFLDGYSQQARKTKRHGWQCEFVDTENKRTILSYSRLEHGCSRGCGLTVDEVGLPDDVCAEAKDKFVASIFVKKWDR